jgi:protein TonB
MRFATLVLIATASVVLLGQSETVYHPGNGVTLPSVVREVRAGYTKEAKDQRIEGTVLMDCVVKADGAVGDVTVTRSLDAIYGLDREAIAALKQWQFRPGVKDGKPVAVQVTVEMTFTLKD